MALEFPDEATIADVLDPVEFPAFVDVRYDPPAPREADPAGAAREAVTALPLPEVPDGGTVAVGLGSRGIRDVVPVARAVVDQLRDRGFEPVVVPAMGSHGGATAEGQRRTLEALGLSAEALGCPIDARMETTVVGASRFDRPVHVATAALEADGILVVNRVKPHTNFTGRVESGLTKMATIGLGKRPGARIAHEVAVEEGYVPAMESALAVIRRETPFLGGVAIVENAEDRTAEVAGVPAAELPDGEAALLERAREQMATLPYDDLDALVVDEIGKDVSGTGMDTNVIGRYRVLNAPEPETPDVDRIVVRGLTEETHGNGHGIGLADVTTTAVIEELDLQQMYANALTSGSLSKDALPVALPTERQALTAALTTAGAYDPETARIAWIENTLELSRFRVSGALAAEGGDHLTVEGRSRLAFEDGRARFEPIE